MHACKRAAADGLVDYGRLILSSGQQKRAFGQISRNRTYRVKSGSENRASMQLRLYAFLHQFKYHAGNYSLSWA
ncbi:hypothetical protein C0Z18_31930 [Trinickia dabaoshanensis]|uniref:Uncharacterized protein n=1 Tax=Trinickia dabaoshanensis TaxID=564714 RepID=A0A2N7VB30_9BURK|nr:hypothetical protein C0Z18_31930 [Trinickia dabaoshanensis]